MREKLGVKEKAMISINWEF